MPDRAVVDDRPIPGPGCDHCEGGLVLVVGRDKIWEETCPRCGPKSIPWSYAAPIDAGLPEPQPRAIVALSEDRQWLVVLEPDIEGHPEATSAFGVWKRDIRAGWVLQAAIIDTGQDAHDVLNEFLDDEFLAGRQG